MREIESITQIYASAALRTLALKTPVYLVPIHDAVGSAFSSVTLKLRPNVDTDDNSPLAAFYLAARGLQWALLADPVPMAAGNTFASERLLTMRELRSVVVSTVSGAVSDLVRLLVDIAEREDLRDSMPLTEALLAELDVLRDSAVVVVPRGRQVEPLKAWLDSTHGKGIEVISASFATSDSGMFRDTFLTLGPPEIYSSQGRSTLAQLIMGPGSEVISFMYPAWSRRSRSPSVSPICIGPLNEIHDDAPQFLARECKPIGDEADIQALNATPTPIRVLEPDEVADLLLEVEGDEAVSGQGILIDCLRMDLAQGYFACVEEGAGRVRTIRFDGAVPQISRETVSSLAVGDIVSFRIGTSEPSELRDRAYEILGREVSELVIDSQGEWKRRLAVAGDLNGWRELDEMLRRRGMVVEGQEKRWATPLAIRPRSDSDFGVLLTFLGYDSAAQVKVLQDAKRLLTAILQAAREVTSQLGQALLDANPDELRDGCCIPVYHEGRFVKSVYVGPILALDAETRPVSFSNVSVALGGGG